MIHCVEADAAAASLLQYRLHQDGIRASVTDLAATFLTNSAQTARYSLCFIGAAFSYEALPDARSDRFDLVFITSDADAGIRHRKGCTSYGLLLDYLTKYSLGVPISATALRRITQDSYDAIAAQFTDVWFDTVPCEALETLLTRLPRGGAILDAGCGPGHHTRFLKKVGFDPIGLDYSRSMLQIARKKKSSHSVHSRRHSYVPALKGLLRWGLVGCCPQSYSCRRSATGPCKPRCNTQVRRFHRTQFPDRPTE